MSVMRLSSRRRLGSRRSAVAAAVVAVAASTAMTGCSDQPGDADAGAEQTQIITESSDALDDADESSTDTTVATAPQTGPDDSPRQPMTAANAAMLDQTIALVGGGELDLAGLTDRPVLLWFWAPF